MSTSIEAMTSLVMRGDKPYIAMIGCEELHKLRNMLNAILCSTPKDTDLKLTYVERGAKDPKTGRGKIGIETSVQTNGGLVIYIRMGEPFIQVIPMPLSTESSKFMHHRSTVIGVEALKNLMNQMKTSLCPMAIMRIDVNSSIGVFYKGNNKVKYSEKYIQSRSTERKRVVLDFKEGDVPCCFHVKYSDFLMYLKDSVSHTKTSRELSETSLSVNDEGLLCVSTIWRRREVSHEEYEVMNLTGRRGLSFLTPTKTLTSAVGPLSKLFSKDKIPGILSIKFTSSLMRIKVGILHRKVPSKVTSFFEKKSRVPVLSHIPIQSQPFVVDLETDTSTITHNTSNGRRKAASSSSRSPKKKKKRKRREKEIDDAQREGSLTGPTSPRRKKKKKNSHSNNANSSIIDTVEGGSILSPSTTDISTGSNFLRKKKRKSANVFTSEGRAVSSTPIPLNGPNSPRIMRPVINVDTVVSMAVNGREGVIPSPPIETTTDSPIENDFVIWISGINKDQ